MSPLTLRPHEAASVLAPLLRDACEIVRADDGALGLFDPRRGVMRIAATWRMPEEENGSEAEPGEGLAGQVLLQRRPVVRSRYGDLPGVTRIDFAENAVLGLPLFRQDELVGFFGIGARPPRRFHPADVEALTVYGRAAAHALHGVRLPDVPLGTASTRLLLIGDQELRRAGLRAFLDLAPEVVTLAEASPGDGALAACARLQPDVVLLSLSDLGPDRGGLGILRRLRGLAPSSPNVLVLADTAGEGEVREALEAGALGYLLHDVSPGHLRSAIGAVRRGEPSLHPEAQRQLMRRFVRPEPRSPLDDLTPRESSVLAEIARGRSNRQIAKALHLSEGTVKGYVSTLLGKLGVEDRTQAALLAVRGGFGAAES